jgi:putative endonuclease
MRPRCPHSTAGTVARVGRTGECRGMAAKDAVGRYGERVAVEYLTAQGMRLLDRNWRCSAGEIDAILSDGSVIVFAEVKTRRSDRYGTPADAVGYVKQTRLRRLAAIWLAQSDVRPHEIRFDLVCVRPQPAGAADVEHLKGAF